MSSMLTPASPSASASSATVPGRLATTTRSSRSGPPPGSASSSRRRSSRGRRVPGGDRVAVAARGSAPPPRRAARRRRRPRRRRPRGCWRRCRPRSPGWRRRRGSCRGSSGRPRACARSRGSAPPRPAPTSDVGDHVRQVADRRHQAVVGLGVDRLRPGAEVGDGRAAGGRRAARWSARVGVRYQRAPSKRSARAFSTPAVSAPASGWPPMKRSSLAERGDDLALGRADVGDDGVLAAGRQRLARQLGEPRRPAPRRRRPPPRRRPRRPRPAARSMRPARQRLARGSPGRGRSRPPRRRSRRRAASPIEPPIRPTPRTAIFISPRRARDRRGQPVEHARRCRPSRCRRR